MHNKKDKLAEIIKTFEISTKVLNLDYLEARLKELKDLQVDPSVWNDYEKASNINKEITQIEKQIFTIESLREKVSSLKDLIELVEEEPDGEIELELTKSLLETEKQMHSFFISTLLSGKYDNSNAILSLQAGAGGTEAQDWVEMLYRMYLRYSEKTKFSVEVLDYQEGDEAGIKNVVLLIKGENAYGLLKAEKGVHRLVRISPFDAGKRRHTSFASLEVLPEITDSSEIVIKNEDLRIDTFRASGAGGQHVNKTESAVRITHLPSGVVVSCQNERSQMQNKATAMKMLLSKLTQLKEDEEEEKNRELKGSLKKIEWGSQIRSYVFCPYTLVKDHRTGYENTNINAVMDGDIEDFIYDYLSKTNS